MNQNLLRSGAALLCMLLFAACSDADAKVPANTDSMNNTQNTGTTAAETEVYNGPDLPASDFSGETFSIYNTCMAEWMAINRVTADEENGDSLNDAVFRRNSKVEERYNIEIEEYQNGDDVEKALMNLIASGDTTYSIYLLREEPAFEIVLQNGAVDYEDIPYLNLDAEWWIQSSMESMSINHRVYYGISAFDTTHYDGTSALYFNKTMADTYDLTSPYTHVEEGTWTIDVMKEMAMTVAEDINGDGKWDEADQYGYGSHERLAGRYLMAGLDAPLSLSKDEDDMLYYDMTTDYYIDRMLKVSSVINDDEGFYHPGAESDNNGGYEYFLAGNMLFYNETLGNAQKLRQMTLDFGILPPPKYSEEQENYRNDVVETYFMLIPTTNVDLERTGILMEALAYESLETVKPAAYDGMLQGIVSRDVESEKMLDLIFDNLSYCHPVALGFTCEDVYERIFSGKTDFASYMEKVRSRVEKAIDKAITAYEENN